MSEAEKKTNWFKVCVSFKTNRRHQPQFKQHAVNTRAITHTTRPHTTDRHTHTATICWVYKRDILPCRTTRLITHLKTSGNSKTTHIQRSSSFKSTYRCHIPQISLLYLCGASRPEKTLPTSTYRCHNSQISLSLYLCGATRPDNTLRPHPPTGVNSSNLSLPVQSKQTGQDAPYIHLQVSHSSNLSLYLCRASRPETSSVHIHLQVSHSSNLSLYLCGVTRPDNKLRPHPPTGVTFLKSLSLYLCGATRPDNTLRPSTYRCHIPQISLSLPVRSDQTGQDAPSTSTYRCHNSQISLSLPVRSDQTRQDAHIHLQVSHSSISLSTCAEWPDRTKHRCMHQILYTWNTSLPSLFATL